MSGHGQASTTRLPVVRSQGHMSTQGRCWLQISWFKVSPGLEQRRVWMSAHGATPPSWSGPARKDLVALVDSSIPDEGIARRVNARALGRPTAIQFSQANCQRFQKVFDV